MAFEVISTNQTVSYTVHSGDEVVILDGVSVSSSSNALAGNNDGAMKVAIHGSITSQSTTGFFGALATSTASLYIVVGETGTVSSLSNSSAFFISRTGAEIINFGQLFSDWTGINFAGSVTSGKVENIGTIHANYGDAIYAAGNFNSVSGTFDVFNSGLVSGGSNGVKVNNQSLDMFNLGTVVGDIGVDITSNLTTTNTLNLNNSGVIIGRDGTAISGAFSDDTIINSGSISGDVLLDGGNDTFDGRGGTVDGWVYGGLGDDTYIIDDATITIIEEAGEGVDVVKSSVSYQLDPYIETLILIGTDNIRGVGNLDADTIVGNVGDNRLQGKGGDDDINGGDGADRVIGGAGNDILRGGDGDDVVLGRTGNDQMHGGNGSDTLQGGRGNDTLRGNNGDDILVGGLGKDVFYGGDGADTFVFSRENESPSGTNNDIIKDFVQGEDMIDLSGIAGTLDFLGAAGFTGTGAEVRVTVTGGVNNVVKIDLDGDGTIDMKVLVEGVIDLDITDFIL